MNYSNNVLKICEDSRNLAGKLNNTQAFVPHVFASMLDNEDIYRALSTSGADVDAIKKDIENECNQCAKLSESIASRYENAHIERQIRLSIDVQHVLMWATKGASSEGAWNTGFVEVSHVMMAIISSRICKTVTTHFNVDTENGKKVVNAFINNLIQMEAREKGIKPARVNINKAGTNNTDAKKQTEEISEFCKDMLAAVASDTKPFVGREMELDALMQCLERRDKPNAILAGPPGVGKTDIVRGLAKRVVEGSVPAQLADVHIYSVDIPGMLAGSEFRGAFEKKLKETIEAACKQERPILFIDEIHTVLGAGKTMDSAMDAANILKPYLTDGKIRVIGATTDDEYRKHVEKDAAFMRRFQKIDVSEPSSANAIVILNGIKPAYESFHSIKINKDAIKSAVELSVRHMHDRYLPDKAIDVIDQTCARVKLNAGKKVTVTDIEETVSKLCHIPAHTVHKDEMEKVRTLDKNLKSKVFGQDAAINVLTEAVQMSKAGLCDETKPIGSFLFVGPSGVGKTEVSKQLAANLGIDFVRFDMSEYAESHSVAKLIGSPAGYVGYDDGGILVEQIRQHPNSVVLFDEIEKAHPDIYKIFLQIFDYGMLSDNKGRKADFRNTIIIMTSNAGNSVAEKARIGFGEMAAASRKDTSMKAIQELMAPELRGRISATIVFDPINNEIAKMIVKKELNGLTAKLRSKGITVKYTDAAIDKIVERGVSAQYGAREIQRVIDNDIKKMFVKLIVSGKTEKNYTVDVANNEFVINAKVAPQAVTVPV